MLSSADRKAMIERLRAAIREVPDFPKPGVSFKDITPLLKAGPLFGEAIDLLVQDVRTLQPTAIVCVEARGFLIAAPMALRLGCGLIPVRKPKKLPWKTLSITYDLEYGKDTLEMHVDGVAKAERVLIVDDVLATGGTAGAVKDLVIKAGGVPLASCFLIELTYLDGRKHLDDLPVHALVTY